MQVAIRQGLMLVVCALAANLGAWRVLLRAAADARGAEPPAAAGSGSVGAECNVTLGCDTRAKDPCGKATGVRCCYPPVNAAIRAGPAPPPPHRPLTLVPTPRYVLPTAPAPMRPSCGSALAVSDAQEAAYESSSGGWASGLGHGSWAIGIAALAALAGAAARGTAVAASPTGRRTCESRGAPAGDPAPPQSRSVLPMALCAVFAAPAAAQPSLSSCAKSTGVFVVNGAPRDMPCPEKVMSAGAEVGAKRLFACSLDGAHLCDGDGRAGTNSTVPINCTSAGFLNCTSYANGRKTQVADVAFSPNGLVVYAACGNGQGVTRCKWNTTLEKPFDCALLPGAECPGTGAESGVAMHTDPTKLVIHCSGNAAEAGVVVCPLSSPGGGNISGTCGKLGESPCSVRGTEYGISFDSDGKLLVGCDTSGHAYCDFSVTGGPTSCTRTQSAPKFCSAGLVGLARLPSGQTGLACFTDGWYICNENPTLSPTSRPDLLPSLVPSPAPTLAPVPAPSLAPSQGAGPAPSLSPSLDPSRAPSRAASGPPSRTATQSPPTADPTVAPSGAAPTQAPALPSRGPSAIPTVMPTAAPTVVPSVGPSPAPTGIPTEAPSVAEPRSTLDIAGVPKGLGSGSDGAQLASSASGASSLAMTLDGRCDYRGTLQKLPRALHPMQIELMDSPYIGCLVGNLVIVVGVAICALVALRLLRIIDDDGNGLLTRDEIPPLMRKLPMFNVKQGEVVDIMAVVKCPSIIVLVFFMLYQGTIFSAFRLLVAPQGDMEGLRRAIGGVSVVILSGIPLFLRRCVAKAVRVRVIIDSDRNVPCYQPLARVRHWDPPLPDHLPLFFFLEGTMGDWVSCARDNHWVNRYQAAVRHFRSAQAVAGLSMDYVVQWVLALANAFPTPTFVLCGHVRLAGCFIALAQVCYIIGYKPYRRWRDNWHQSARLLVQAFALGALTTEFYYGREEGAGFWISGWCGMLASAIAGAKVVLDLAAEALLIKTGRRNDLQRREWTEEALRKKRLGEAAKERRTQAKKMDLDPFTRAWRARSPAEAAVPKEAALPTSPAVVTGAEAAGGAGKAKGQSQESTGPVLDSLDWLPLLPTTGRARPGPLSPLVPAAAAGGDKRAEFEPRSPPETRKTPRTKRGGRKAASRRRRVSHGGGQERVGDSAAEKELKQLPLRRASAGQPVPLLDLVSRARTAGQSKARAIDL
eukprot:TRINITY_DN18617_c0_g2_i3.p1 TRINITY_DN18617_c0_g2~~TRINITY_DN18617_c0_g2_i3.p1  ORF type:complete len:1201 (+),score=98.71 TRINITY_DN18617_c0_g2_i3:109-3711(+)